MDTDLKPAFLLPPSPEVAAEEAAAQGVRLTAIEFFPVVVILGMMAGAAAWLRPSIEAQTHQHHSLLYRVVTWPARQLIHAVGAIEARVMHAMSHWLGPKVGTVAHAINSVTHEVHAVAQVLADTADNTHEALTWLRHQVVPQLIQDALKPIRARLVAVENELELLPGRLKTAADEIADQLATLGFVVGRTFTAAIGQLATRFVELWNYVHEELLPKVETLVLTVKQLQEVTIPKLETAIDTLTTTITQTIPDELTAIRNRIAAIEDTLAPAAILAAIAVLLETTYEWLFCPNMERAGKAVCGMRKGLLDFLLGAGAAMFLFSELCRLIELMGVVAARVLPTLIAPLAVAGAALCDGKHSAAPNLPLATTALPQVNNPLAL